MEQEIKIKISDAELFGNITVPDDAKAIIIFAHGSGSSRFSPRNRMVANVLNRAGLATLLFDLLNKEEEHKDTSTAEFRFNIPLITRRLTEASRWLLATKEWGGLKIGYFGASTGAAAALNTTADLPKSTFAVVSRGGRPDLADDKKLANITTPCLFIVGGNDDAVIIMNEEAIKKMTNSKSIGLKIIPGATHLLDEPGKLEEVAELAKNFYLSHIRS